MIDRQVKKYFLNSINGWLFDSLVIHEIVDTLSYNKRIDQISNMEVHPFKTQLMWSENPGGAATPSYGGWYYAKNTRYIGIKLNNKFGWIEIDNTDNFHPKFIRYAIVK